MNITIILAAGEGTRMKSKKSKVLHKIVNRTLIDYVYDASCDAGSRSEEHTSELQSRL